MPVKLKIQEKTLKKIEQQRDCWLKVILLFAPSTALVILEWNNILSLDDNLWILVALIMSGIGFTWWFWTLIIIKKLIDYRIIEIQLITHAVEEIKSINNDFKNLK